MPQLQFERHSIPRKEDSVTSKSSSKALEAIGTIAVVTITAWAINLLGALWVMLALGVAHHTWPAVPALGYWAVYLLLCGLYTVAGVFRRAASPRTKEAQA